MDFKSTGKQNFYFYFYIRKQDFIDHKDRKEPKYTGNIQEQRQGVIC